MTQDPADPHGGRPPDGAPPGQPPSSPSGPPGYPGGGHPGRHAGEPPGYPPPGAPYPPQQGYSGPSTGGHAGRPFAVGEAVSYGWRAVTSNLGPWLLVALIFLVVNIAWNLITGGFSRLWDSYDDNGASVAAVTGLTFTSIVLSIVGTIIGYLITAFLTRGALDETAGRRPDVAAFFRIANVVNVVLAALLVTILTTIGLVLCIVPGLAVIVFSVFVYNFTLDRQQDAIAAIRSSWSLVAKSFGTVLLLLLALLGINILGAIPLGLGLFVTIPLSYVAVAFAYRRLLGEQPA
jgi:uncharacterized membrane protein